MAAKISISFVLLALFVAASIQMPDQSSRSRVKREDEPEKSAETTPAPEVGGESEAAGADGGGHAEGGKPVGGGFSSIGANGTGGGGPFPQGIPGKDFFSKVVQSFSSGKPPKPDEWIKAIPFMNTFFSDEQN